jgi:hypothetical protein
LVPVPALVDSGSDRSSFPLRLGVAVGFTYDGDKPPEIGAGQIYNFEYWEATNSIKVESEVGPFSILNPFLVRGGPGYIVLGRYDFFNSFKVSFNGRDEEMEIETYGRILRH